MFYDYRIFNACQDEVFYSIVLLSRLSNQKIKNEDDILPTFKNYAVTINEIRLKYRNKAAHTDALTQTDAKSCFDLVIDVTKFLKMMLDSFDE